MHLEPYEMGDLDASGQVLDLSGSMNFRPCQIKFTTCLKSPLLQFVPVYLGSQLPWLYQIVLVNVPPFCRSL